MKKPKLSVDNWELLERFKLQRKLFRLAMDIYKSMPEEDKGLEVDLTSQEIMKVTFNWLKELNPTEKDFLNANGLPKFIQKVESYAKEYNIDLHPNDAD